MCEFLLYFFLCLSSVVRSLVDILTILIFVRDKCREVGVLFVVCIFCINEKMEMNGTLFENVGVEMRLTLLTLRCNVDI